MPRCFSTKPKSAPGAREWMLSTRRLRIALMRSHIAPSSLSQRDFFWDEARIVATILASSQLKSLWERELGAMCERIKAMRKRLVDNIHSRAPGADFGFVLKQRGMFSYSGLTREQVRRLREEHSIYAIDTGRICVAALNTKNVDYVADAIAKVIR